MPLTSTWFAGDPTFTAASNNAPPMMKGNAGPAVKVLQQCLIEIGYPLPKSTVNGVPDGDYGSETKSQVISFQMKNGLKGAEADGRVGKNTLAKLDAQIRATGKPKPIFGGGPGPAPALDAYTQSVIDILREPAVQMMGFVYEYNWFGGSDLLKVVEAIEKGQITVQNDRNLMGWGEYVPFPVEGRVKNRLYFYPFDLKLNTFFKSSVVHEAVHAYHDIRGYAMDKYSTEGLAYAAQAWYYMAATGSAATPSYYSQDPPMAAVYAAAVQEIQEARANKTAGMTVLHGVKITARLREAPVYIELADVIPYDGL